MSFLFDIIYVLRFKLFFVEVIGHITGGKSCEIISFAVIFLLIKNKNKNLAFEQGLHPHTQPHTGIIWKLFIEHLPPGNS